MTYCYSIDGMSDKSFSGWNASAIECYNNKCTCSKCHQLDGLELKKTQCKMKYAVLGLVRKFGVPPKESEQ